jgi:hypothetical protein
MTRPKNVAEVQFYIVDMLWWRTKFNLMRDQSDIGEVIPRFEDYSTL